MLKLNLHGQENVPQTHQKYLREMSAEKQKAVLEKTEQVEKIIFRDDMPPVIKAFAAYQYMAVASIYDLVNYYQKHIRDHNQTLLPEDDYSMYGAMCRGIGVCAGVARCVCMLLERQNVECRVIRGKLNGGGHAWNIVSLHGEWYQIDATAAENYFARHRIDKSFDVNLVWWKWFLKTDEEMRQTGREWTVTDYPKCSSGRFSGDHARKAVEDYNANGERKLLTSFIAMNRRN